MKVGIIGICGFGRFHAEAFETLGWQVAAAADHNDKLNETAVRFGAEPYHDYRKLLERTDLDAVSVSLPPKLHPEVVRAALDKNLPVFCEKPVAPSAAEAEALLLKVGSDAPIMVGFPFRYNTAYLRLRELIGSGALGRVRTILARKCWGTRTSWRLEPGGGALFIKDIHYYDLIPWLLDSEPDRLCAFGGPFYHDSSVEDSYQLLMNFRCGTTFHLDSAWWTLPMAVSHFEVVGERARVLVEEDELRIEGEGARVERPDGEAMVLAEIRAFTGWLAGEGERPPGLREAVRANRLAQKAKDMLESNAVDRG